MVIEIETLSLSLRKQGDARGGGRLRPASQMLIPEAKVQEILERTDIVGLIGRRVELKRAGHALKGLCPFHGERTPSFIVTPERRRFKCFGCGAGGDAISFVMKQDGKSFVDAAKELAAAAGVRLDDAGDDRLQREKLNHRRVHQLATRFYMERLWDQRAGQAARAFLKKRGLTRESLEHFQLGVAPTSWDEFSKRAAKEGMLELALSAGLVNERAREFHPSDRGNPGVDPGQHRPPQPGSAAPGAGEAWSSDGAGPSGSSAGLRAGEEGHLRLLPRPPDDPHPQSRRGHGCIRGAHPPGRRPAEVRQLARVPDLQEERAALRHRPGRADHPQDRPGIAGRGLLRRHPAPPGRAAQRGGPVLGLAHPGADKAPAPLRGPGNRADPRRRRRRPSRRHPCRGGLARDRHAHPGGRAAGRRGPRRPRPQGGRRGLQARDRRRSAPHRAPNPERASEEPGRQLRSSPQRPRRAPADPGAGPARARARPLHHLALRAPGGPRAHADQGAE